MPQRESPMTARRGFTILELLVVLTLAGIIVMIAIPNFTRGMNRMRSRSAATVLAADLQLAHSMAARQRRPVQIVIDTANKVVRLRDFVTPARIYRERYYTASSEHPVQSMTATSLLRTVFPNGLADGTLSITVNAGGERRIVDMTRVGLVRVTTP